MTIQISYDLTRATSTRREKVDEYLENLGARRRLETLWTLQGFQLDTKGIYNKLMKDIIQKNDRLLVSNIDTGDVFSWNLLS